MIWLYIWLTVGAVMLLIEFITNKIFAVWGLFGAIGAGVSSVWLSWYYTLIVFVAISGLLILCVRKTAIKAATSSYKSRLVLSVVGKEFMLLTPIKINQSGTIKIRGVVCEAISIDANPIAESTNVKIVDYKNNKAVVKIS